MKDVRGDSGESLDRSTVQHDGDRTDQTTHDRPASRKLHNSLRVAVGVFGIFLIVAGVIAVFESANGAGSAALIAAGALIAVLAAFEDRLESIRLGDFEMALLRKAREAADQGDMEAAVALKRAADAVGQRKARTARAYVDVRTRMLAGQDRTNAMNEIIAEAEKDAQRDAVDPEEVLSLLWTGPVGARVWALGVLKARPELATPRAILEAVARPDHMFDQYHALQLADRFVRLASTRPWQKERIAEAVRLQRESGALGEDPECHAEAERVLRYVSQNGQ